LCEDDDDPKPIRLEMPRVRTQIGPRLSFTQWLNVAARENCQQYPIIGWSADDVRYLKPGWDLMIRQAMQGQEVKIVYGPDGIQNEKLPTHPFVTSSIVKALGYLIYPGLRHYYNDNYLKSLGTALGCLRYHPNFVIEHRHHSTGKSPFDMLYSSNEKHFDSDAKTFTEQAAPQAEADAAKIHDYLAKERDLAKIALPGPATIHAAEPKFALAGELRPNTPEGSAALSSVQA